MKRRLFLKKFSVQVRAAQKLVCFLFAALTVVLRPDRTWRLKLRSERRLQTQQIRDPPGRPLILELCSEFNERPLQMLPAASGGLWRSEMAISHHHWCEIPRRISQL